MTEQPHATNSPFWNPAYIFEKLEPEWISDPLYFREFCKGIAEQLYPEDWARLYSIAKTLAKSFLLNGGLKVNGLLAAQQLGLKVGKDLRDKVVKG